jgi:hypothetical protein
VTPDQQSLLEALKTALKTDSRILSAWLTGSLGSGRGDAWSDIDITLVAGAGDIPDLLGDLMARDGPLPTTALRLSQFGRLVNATTPSLQRFDLLLSTPEEFARHNATAVKLLFGDPSEGPAERAPPPSDPAAVARRVEALVTEFLRILSLAPVAAGRREWVVMQDGVGHLRRLLIELMLEENGVGPAERGGAKKLYPFLTAEQIAELEVLVPPRVDEAQLIAANRDLRDRFLPRALRVAGATGAVWPEAWEAAVMSGLARDLPALA